MIGWTFSSGNTTLTFGPFKRFAYFSYRPIVLERPIGLFDQFIFLKIIIGKDRGQGKEQLGEKVLAGKGRSGRRCVRAENFLL